MFMAALDTDEMVAQLLVSEGFTSLEEVAYVELDELTVVDGFDEETAEELQARARESLEELNAKALEKAREMGVQEDLIEFDGLSPQMVLALAEDGIKALAAFATCADWELAGGWTTQDGERIKDDGLLETYGVNIDEARDKEVEVGDLLSGNGDIVDGHVFAGESESIESDTDVQG